MQKNEIFNLISRFFLSQLGSVQKAPLLYLHCLHVIINYQSHLGIVSINLASHILSLFFKKRKEKKRTWEHYGERCLSMTMHAVSRLEQLERGERECISASNWEKLTRERRESREIQRERLRCLCMHGLSSSALNIPLILTRDPFNVSVVQCVNVSMPPRY